MRIKIDEVNKTVIASGTYRGKRIKAVCVCREEEFNKDFGVKLAKQKYKIKKRFAKLKFNESLVRQLLIIKQNIEKELDNREKIIESIDTKLQCEIQECENFISNFFGNNINE